MQDTRIAKSLKSLRQVALRQETTKFRKQFYVDQNVTDNLITKNWQVLFGRRGTGKTTNLLALADRINTGQIKENSIAVYVDISRCTPSDYGATTDIEAQREAATHYFRDFIKKICMEIFDTYTDEENNSFFENLVNKSRANRKRLEDIILEIRSIADSGTFVMQPQSTTITHAEMEGDITEVGGSASIKNLVPAISVQGKLGESSKNQTTEVQTFVFKEVSRYRALSDKIKDLRDILKLDSIYILIDE